MSEPRYSCGLCGRRRPAAQMVYSKWTGARYCAIEQVVCEIRARKRKRPVTA